ncbi:hypothetical protein KI743_13255 [Vibrio sp. D420a]|uniref:hypothetical protein n=1 Tax=Vibrio sp. D420a TaxID=2836895 RepID=UPI002555B40C|nr:hypothetical protein [Vibrio sp. D420a]MDK9762973.1 hypothetical protein [Vibrio sp. D420a]
MSKKENTLIALETALERIIQGNPKRIPNTRKLSVRAVEEEANLGNGSGYYYPDFVVKVKQAKADIAKVQGKTVRPDIDSVREKLNDQKRIKEGYKEKNAALKNTLSQFATQQHHLNDALRKALVRVDELENENAELRDALAKAKRSQVTSIK